MHVIEFYDDLSPFYHLVYADWEAGIARQAKRLDSIIRDFSPAANRSARAVLDAACGVGTQSIGLAQLGYRVAASDVSPGAVARAREEAAARELAIDFRVADMRELSAHHCGTFDVVIACDNAVPHLLDDAGILAAFEQFHRCAAPGGVCIVSARDYAAADPAPVTVVPYGLHIEGGVRYGMFQVWELHDRIYDVTLYLIEDRDGERRQTRIMRTQYYAVPIARLMELLGRAGFRDVQRLDGRFFQPVIVGRKLGAEVCD